MAVKCILTGQIPSVLDGVTENVQSQIDEINSTVMNVSQALSGAIDGKQDSITGGASTITDDNLTASRALVSDASGKVAVSDVTATELSYLDGVTSNIQTQLNSKLSSAPVTSVAGKTGAVTLDKSDVGLGNVDNTSDADKPISTATQEALDEKLSLSGGTMTGAIDILNSASNTKYSIGVGGAQNFYLSAVGNFTTTANWGRLELNSEGALLGTTAADNITLSRNSTKIAMVVTPTADTDAANKAYVDTSVSTKQPAITASGILQGDGAGNITAAEEAEVSLVSLTVDMVEGAAPLNRILNITLPAASWTGDGPYTQTVTITDGTANTKVDIMFDADTYQQMVDDGVGFLAIDNDSGVFTATAKGGQPSADLNIQVECKEVTPPQQ